MSQNRGHQQAYCSELSSGMYNYFTRQYIPEDNSEHHTRRRENSHRLIVHPAGDT
jgi:hypothetical protein